MKITGSLIVCSAAALFTVGALLVNDGPDHGAAAPHAASGATAGTAAQIDIQDFAFTTVRVAPGGTVVVANHDGIEHTVSGANGAFETGAVPGGKAVSFAAPSAPATYQFVCAIHPSMTGQLIVG
jgi:plastocyanin